MIEKILIISFCIFTVYASIQDDMIFEKVGNWIESKVGEFWYKPLGGCVVCMGGIWGAGFYWLIYGNNAKEWAVVNLSVIGLNFILTRMFNDN